MGSRGDSGASGSDAGFQNTQKSKLSKKNQDIVDASFDKRGGVKLDQAKILPTSVETGVTPVSGQNDTNNQRIYDIIFPSKEDNANRSDKNY